MDGQLPFAAKLVRYDQRELERSQLSGLHRDSPEKVQKEK